MQALIATTSLFAAVIGIVAIAPQLMTMHRSRSAAGQSIVGWGMGLVTNTSMAFVNLVGYHATILGTGNVVSGVGCASAIWLVCRHAAPGHGRALHAASELETHEFEALADLVVTEHHRRTGEPEITLALSPA